MLPDTFAFIMHPLNPKEDVARKYPALGMLPEWFINWGSRWFPPVLISPVKGVVSHLTGRELTGHFIGCPYTPSTMLRLPVQEVYEKIIACGRLAQQQGARILGLGAFTSVVGDAGRTIADRLEIPVTTGDSYTVYMAIQAAHEAAEVMGVDYSNSTVAVVGASGAIGGACSDLLADEVGKLIMVGRRPEALEQKREQLTGRRAQLLATTEIQHIYAADVVITVTSAVHAVIEPKHLKPGAIVLDVARPRDVSRQVEEERDDVLVIEGGMVEVPGPVNFGFNFGFPPGKSYACMAETMALALEGRYEDYTIGKELELSKVLEVGAIATRHGFKLSGFRSFERAVTEEHINVVREKAALNLRSWSPAL
jgi:predicted amino acid dehydrogenase